MIPDRHHTLHIHRKSSRTPGRHSQSRCSIRCQSSLSEMAISTFRTEDMESPSVMRRSRDLPDRQYEASPAAFGSQYEVIGHPVGRIHASACSYLRYLINTDHRPHAAHWHHYTTGIAMARQSAWPALVRKEFVFWEVPRAYRCVIHGYQSRGTMEAFEGVMKGRLRQNSLGSTGRQAEAQSETHRWIRSALLIGRATGKARGWSASCCTFTA